MELIRELFSSAACANIIALMALFFSLYSLWSNRKIVYVEFADNLEIVFSKNLYIGGDNSLLGVPVVFYGYIKILNPSSTDLSFFDLRAFNTKTNENYGIFTRKRLPSACMDASLVLVDEYRQINLEIPQAKHGILKANAFTYLDVLVYEVPHSCKFDDHICISFKTPQKNLFCKDSFAVTNRKQFKTHNFLYAIAGWEQIFASQKNTYRDVEP